MPDVALLRKKPVGAKRIVAAPSSTFTGGQGGVY